MRADNTNATILKSKAVLQPCLGSFLLEYISSFAFLHFHNSSLPSFAALAPYQLPAVTSLLLFQCRNGSFVHPLQKVRSWWHLWQDHQFFFSTFRETTNLIEFANMYTLMQIVQMYYFTGNANVSPMLSRLN